MRERDELQMNTVFFAEDHPLYFNRLDDGLYIIGEVKPMFEHDSPQWVCATIDSEGEWMTANVSKNRYQVNNV